MCSPSKRREMDVMKLMMSDWKVELVEDNISEFYVEFSGPKDSPYEGGVWRLHVELPEAYPYKSPSIGFVNKIFHPNVDEGSGSVCLDVINQTWSPMFDLINVFEVFLPQLLLYPNPTDPLNGDAAALLMREPNTYNTRVKIMCDDMQHPAIVQWAAAKPVMMAAMIRWTRMGNKMMMATVMDFCHLVKRRRTDICHEGLSDRLSLLVSYVRHPPSWVKPAL